MTCYVLEPLAGLDHLAGGSFWTEVAFLLLFKAHLLTRRGPDLLKAC